MHSCGACIIFDILKLLLLFLGGWVWGWFGVNRTVELEIQTDPSPSESVECQTIPMGTDFSAQTEQMGVDFWVQTDASAVLVDGSMQTHTEIQTQTYTEPVDMGTQTGVEDTDPDISVAFSALDEFGTGGCFGF